MSCPTTPTTTMSPEMATEVPNQAPATPSEAVSLACCKRGSTSTGYSALTVSTCSRRRPPRASIHAGSSLPFPSYANSPRAAQHHPLLAPSLHHHSALTRFHLHHQALACSRHSQLHHHFFRPRSLALRSPLQRKPLPQSRGVVQHPLARPRPASTPVPLDLVHLEPLRGSSPDSLPTRLFCPKRTATQPLPGKPPRTSLPLPPATPARRAPLSAHVLHWQTAPGQTAPAGHAPPGRVAAGRRSRFVPARAASRSLPAVGPLAR